MQKCVIRLSPEEARAHNELIAEQLRRTVIVNVEAQRAQQQQQQQQQQQHKRGPGFDFTTARATGILFQFAHPAAPSKSHELSFQFARRLGIIINFAHWQ